jgi:DNA-binding NarL/FixJ family response regulator
MRQPAGELHTSLGTLRNHLSHINEKLHTHNRVEAMIQARRRSIMQ